MNLITPFLIGFFSSIHCLVMCGGICGLFCKNTPNISGILLINLGRIITYTILGIIFAGIIQGLALRIPVAEFGIVIRTILGIVLVFLGIRILLNKSSLHSYFNNNYLWNKVKPTLHRFASTNSVFSNLTKGFLWGLIPCGLLYAVLLAAATTNNYYQGGLFMLAFGIGTLPSMLIAAGMFKSMRKLLNTKFLRFSAGIFIIIIGLWSLISPWFSDELILKHPVFTPIIAFLDKCIP